MHASHCNTHTLLHLHQGTLPVQVLAVINAAKEAAPAHSTLSRRSATESGTAVEATPSAGAEAAALAARCSSASGSESAPSAQHIHFPESDDEDADQRAPGASQAAAGAVDAPSDAGGKPQACQPGLPSRLQAGGAVADNAGRAAQLPSTGQAGQPGMADTVRMRAQPADASLAAAAQQTQQAGSSAWLGVSHAAAKRPAELQPASGTQSYAPAAKQTQAAAGAEPIDLSARGPRRNRVRMQAAGSQAAAGAHRGGLASLPGPSAVPAACNAPTAEAADASRSAETNASRDPARSAAAPAAGAGVCAGQAHAAAPRFELPLVGAAAQPQPGTSGATGSAHAGNPDAAAALQHDLMRNPGAEVRAAMADLHAENAVGAGGAGEAAAAVAEQSTALDIPSSVRERYGNARAIKRSIADLFEEQAAAPASGDSSSEGSVEGRLGDVTTLMLKSDRPNRGARGRGGDGRGRGGTGRGRGRSAHAYDRHAAHANSKEAAAFVGFDYAAEQGAAQVAIAKRARGGGGRGRGRGGRGQRPTNGFNPFEIEDATVAAPTRKQSRGGNKSAVL